MNEDKFPEGFFDELGHGRVIEPNIDWAEWPKGEYFPASILPYPGNVEDAATFLYRAEVFLNARRMVTGQGYLIERCEPMHNDPVQLSLTGYTHCWNLKLLPRNKELPEIRNVGGVFMVRQGDNQTKILIRTHDKARFYQMGLDEYFNQEVNGVFPTHSTEKTKPLSEQSSEGKSNAAATPQPAGINISHINSARDVNINFSHVAGHDQNTTTTSTTITQQASPAAANPSNTPPSMMTPAQFNELLRQQFNESELKDVCLALKIDYELLPGNSKADKTRELILYLQRRGRIQELLTLVKKDRPNTSWPDTIQ